MLLFSFIRKTRQFIGVNVLVPDSHQLIQSVFLSAPVLHQGKTGKALTESITQCLAEAGIKGHQVSSAAFDGAYFNCHVDQYLREELKLDEESLPCVWDWMHSAGLSGVGHKMKQYIYWNDFVSLKILWTFLGLEYSYLEKLVSKWFQECERILDIQAKL